MSEAELPVAWLSIDGTIHGAPPGAPAAISLPPGMQVHYAVADGEHLACAYCGPGNSAPCSVTMYSLRTGLAQWAAPVPAEWILGFAGEAVWAGSSGEELLHALDVGTGAVLKTLPITQNGSAAVVSQGRWIGHLLYMDDEHISLLAPLAAHCVWKVSKNCDSTHLRALDDWFYTARWYSPGEAHSFYNMADGSRARSTLLNPTNADPTAVEKWLSRSVEILIARSPDSALVYASTQLDTCIALVDGSWSMERMSVLRPKILIWKQVLPPRVQSAEVVVVYGGHVDFRIIVVGSETAAILGTRSAPNIVTAWHWTPRQYAERESAAAADAVAAVDAVASINDGRGAIGLVRAVLVGFVAEDARLTVLKHAFCCGAAALVQN